MGNFRISTHGRLQDWIAAEKGYFDDEGLRYEMDVKLLENAEQDIPPGVPTAPDVRVGAYELYRSGGGGKKDMSCACHWAVNQAATDAAGRMWGHAYSVLPSAIYVPADSEIRGPEDLAEVEVAVGYHSGSHFSTIQALEAFLDSGQIKLAFTGMPYDRVDALLDGGAEAAAVWGVQTDIVEQLGCRKVLDSTFMAGFMFNSETDPSDVERYFRALKRAQMDLDLEPERYKHHYLKEIPPRFRGRVDIRRFGPGERVVFLPYTREMYERSQRWMQERGLFEERDSVPVYDSVVQV
jgi:ABC-type nitrate/sulfonate/bicarbonate transport system substrate-binding protein